MTDREPRHFFFPQDKVRKVVDIWAKAGTFSSTVLTTISAQLVDRVPSPIPAPAVPVSLSASSAAAAIAAKVVADALVKTASLQQPATVPATPQGKSIPHHTPSPRHLGQAHGDVSLVIALYLPIRYSPCQVEPYIPS